MTDERFDELVKRAMRLAWDVTATPGLSEHYGQIFSDILRHLIDNENKANRETSAAHRPLRAPLVAEAATGDI